MTKSKLKIQINAINFEAFIDSSKYFGQIMDPYFF